MDLSRISYDPNTGEFRWVKKRPGPNQGACGFVRKDGYRGIKLCGREYLAHRLAWFITHGEWPGGEVDHINGDRGDNRIVNLRDVPRQANMQNVHAPRKNNKLGLRGVRRKGNRFEARITKQDGTFYAKSFATPKEAAEAYRQAKMVYQEGAVCP